MTRQRTTTTGALLLEAVLVVALLSATVFGLARTVVSPLGLRGSIPDSVVRLGERVVGPEFFGEVPAVRTDIAPTIRVTTSPQLYFYGSEEIPNGRGEFSGPYQAQVNAYSPTMRQRIAFLGAGLAASLSTIAVLALLLLVVRSLRSGDPFVLANARRLRGMAAVLAVGGTGASALRAWAEHLVLSDRVIMPLVHEQLQVTFLPLVAGLGVLLLAEVFRRGALMRAELEGLV